MVQVKLTFDRKGNHYLGTAEIPTATGPLTFKTLIPLDGVRTRVREWLANQPAIAGDPQVIGALPDIENRVARIQAKRRLGTAIKIRFGGRVRPYEVAGSAGHAVRLARVASRRNYFGGEDDNEVSGIGKFFKKVGRGIGKGIKATGKGIGKGAKAVGKGTYKVTKAVVKNPITGALLTQVPGGAAAMAIVNAAKGGSPGAQQAIADINSLANAGDVQAIQSRDALNAAKPGPSPLLIGGIAAAAAGALILAAKK